jgi:uncharacterized phage protein (TIGR02218 family)
MSEAWLQGPLTSSTYGWRLERRDGVTLGFTSHDRDVELDGVILRASPGMMPSSIVESIGMDVDGLDVRGAMTSDAIRADDLTAGRWDAARLSIFLFDWTEPSAGIRMLAVGELGAISHSGNEFDAEFRGPAAKLDRSVAPYTSPGCRADFCGEDCGLNAARFTHPAQIVAFNGSELTLAAPLPALPANFAFGKLRWLDGPNCGLWSDILMANASSVQLAASPPFPVLSGGRAELIEGCDKTIAICGARFGNAINFRGEPYLPGNDILTRYPGAGS